MLLSEALRLKFLQTMKSRNDACHPKGDRNKVIIGNRRYKKKRMQEKSYRRALTLAISFRHTFVMKVVVLVCESRITDN